MSLLNHVVIVQLTALPSWLSLARGERQRVIAEQVGPALNDHPGCSVRWIDAEAMTAQCSDVVIVETRDLRAWNHLWERLRDSDLFAVPYFRTESIVMGIEDGYLDYEATLPAEDVPA